MPHSLRGSEENQKISTMTVGVLAEIRSQELLNTRTVQEQCRVSHLTRKSLPPQNIPQQDISASTHTRTHVHK